MPLLTPHKVDKDFLHRVLGQTHGRENFKDVTTVKTSPKSVRESKKRRRSGQRIDRNGNGPSEEYVEGEELAKPLATYPPKSSQVSTSPASAPAMRHNPLAEDEVGPRIIRGRGSPSSRLSKLFSNGKAGSEKSIVGSSRMNTGSSTEGSSSVLGPKRLKRTHGGIVSTSSTPSLSVSNTCVPTVDLTVVTDDEQSDLNDLEIVSCKSINNSKEL